jgi:hypothetical protein
MHFLTLQVSHKLIRFPGILLYSVSGRNKFRLKVWGRKGIGKCTWPSTIVVPGNVVVMVTDLKTAGLHQYQPRWIEQHVQCHAWHITCLVSLRWVDSWWLLAYQYDNLHTRLGKSKLSCITHLVWCKETYMLDTSKHWEYLLKGRKEYLSTLGKIRYKPKHAYKYSKARDGIVESCGKKLSNW